MLFCNKNIFSVKIILTLLLFALVSCNSAGDKPKEIEEHFYLEIRQRGYCIHADAECAKNTTYISPYRVYDNKLCDFLCATCFSNEMASEMKRRQVQFQREDAILKDAYYKFKNIVNYEESYAYFREEVMWKDNLKWLYEFMKFNNKPIYKGTYDQLFLVIGIDRTWANPDVPIDFVFNPSFEERYGKPQTLRYRNLDLIP